MIGKAGSALRHARVISGAKVSMEYTDRDGSDGVCALFICNFLRLSKLVERQLKFGIA